MMSYYHVGSGAYEHVGFMTLQRNGLQRMFASPVQGDDDDGGGVVLAQVKHPLQQRVHRLLADAGFVGKIGIVLESQPQRG